MIFENVTMSTSDVKKLLSAANADASLLYIYLQSGNAIDGAASDLNLSPSRITCAAA